MQSTFDIIRSNLLSAPFGCLYKYLVYIDIYIMIFNLSCKQTQSFLFSFIYDAMLALEMA